MSKWKKIRLERKQVKKQRSHEKLDQEYRKRMKKGYDEGLSQNLRFRTK